MGLFSKLTGRPAEAQTTPTLAVECPHTALTARWESVADMGHEDRATRFRCESCGATLAPAEAHALRASEAERLSLSQEQRSLN